jgi:hypothetical protein
MHENDGNFGFALTADEIAAIKAIDRREPSDPDLAEVTP